MSCCTRCFSPRFLNRKRFNFLSLSTSACAAADYHSDDSVVVNLSNYVELHRRMRMQAELGDLDKVYDTLMLMKGISGKPTVLDYNAMVNCYFTSRNVCVTSVFEVLDWMQKHGPRPNAGTYFNVLNGLVFIGFLEDGIRVAQRMIDSSFVPPHTVISELFKKLVKSGNLKGSGVVLELILSLGYTPSSYQVGIYVRDLCKAGMVKVAFEVVAAVSQIPYFAKGYVFNPILRSLCMDRKMTIVLSFIGWLNKKGLTLDVYSYTALVNGFGKEKLWGEVTNCLNEMKRVGCVSMVTYTVIVKCLCDDGKLDEALKILQEMEAEGCYPDLVTFNIVLGELSCQSRFVEVYNLLQCMEQKGLQPDRYTVAGIAGGMLKAGKIKRVNAFLKDIISKGCFLDDVVYNIYLHSISLLNGSKEALAVVPKMMEMGFRPTNVSYNIILKGLLTENDDIDESCRLCHHVKPANETDLISFNIMMSAACKQEDSAMIRRIFRKMECEGIKPDVITMTCLIQYYSRIRKIEQCFQLLTFMFENGCHPNTITLNTLLIELCKKRLLRTAKAIFSHFKDIGISPDTTTYNILLRASIREHNVALVNELLGDMYGQKVKHDSGTYGCFLYSHCQTGKISLALQFLGQMRESGMLPDTFMYNTMIKAMLKRGMLKEVILLLRHMVIDGLEPNEGTFSALAQAYKTGCLKGFPGVVNELVLAFFDTGKWTNERLGE